MLPMNLPQPQESLLLTIEPYKTYNRKMKSISQAELDGTLIEIPIPEDATFCRSFLNDEYYISSPTVEMRYHRISAIGEKLRYLLQLTCRWYIDDEAPIGLYNQAASAIESQAMSMYLPHMPVDVSVKLSCDFEISMVALLPEEANLVDCGNLLISQLITMFTFANDEE